GRDSDGACNAWRNRKFSGVTTVVVIRSGIAFIYRMRGTKTQPLRRLPGPGPDLSEVPFGGFIPGVFWAIRPVQASRSRRICGRIARAAGAHVRACLRGRKKRKLLMTYGVGLARDSAARGMLGTAVAAMAIVAWA